MKSINLGQKEIIHFIGIGGIGAIALVTFWLASTAVVLVLARLL